MLLLMLRRVVLQPVVLLQPLKGIGSSHARGPVAQLHTAARLRVLHPQKRGGSLQASPPPRRYSTVADAAEAIATSKPRLPRWLAIAAAAATFAVGGIWLYLWWGWRAYPPGVRQRMRAGLRAQMRGDLAEAEQAMQEAVELTEQDVRMKDEPAAVLLRSGFLRVRLAEVYQQAGKNEEAAREYAICFDIFRRGGLPEKALAVVQEMVAPLENLGMLEEAEQVLRWAIKQAEGPLHLDDGKIGPFHVQLGEVLHAAGKEEEGMEAYRKALAIATKVVGRDSCEVALILNNMSALSSTNAGAEAYAEEALELSLRKCPNLVALSNYNLGRAKEAKPGNEAEQLLLKAKQLAYANNDQALIAEFKRYESEKRMD